MSDPIGNGFDGPDGGAEGVEGIGIDGGPPVSEDLLMKERALEAERELEELRTRLAETEAMLEEARSALAQATRRAEVERRLHGAGALDVETARVMVESMLDRDESMDVASAVAALRRDKPFLFSADSARGAIAGVAAGGRDPLASAADEARGSGDRRALLRYLRLRRGVE